MSTLAIKTLFPGTDKAISFAHIPANQILTHFLALGYECYVNHASFGEDLSQSQNASSSLLHDDVPYCEFFRDAHRDVKEMMTNNPDVSKNTRVVILRVWSDRFEAHNVKGNAQFNSL